MKKIRFGISFKPLSDSKEINPHVINAWPNSLKNLITDLYIEEISEAKQSCFFNTYAKSCLGQCPNIKSIETIVTKLPIQIDRTVGEKITYIKIEGNVEDYDFQFLSSHCSNLKKLHLGYQPENPIISKQAILFLEHMSGLTMFIAPHFIIPEDTIKNLKQTWPYLRKLELKNLDQFT